MPINDKVLQLYTAMKADGADVGTEQEFNDYFLAKGEQGYKNRKAVWDAFRADGADVGENYEEFASWLGLQAAKPQPIQRNADAMAKKMGVSLPNAQPQQQTAPQPADSYTPEPQQFPQGFGELDVNQANQDMLRRMRGENTWEQPSTDNAPEPQQEKNLAKQLKQAIKGDEKAAKESGVDTAAKRMQEELAYTQATGKPLANIVNTPVTAPTAVQTEDGQMLMGQTTDEQRVKQYQQQERETVRKQIVKDAVDRIQQQMEADAMAKYGETQKDNGLDPDLQAGRAFAGFTQYLKDSSPEELLKRLNETYGYDEEGNNASDFANRFLNDNREVIEQAAARSGMRVEDFVYDEVLPQLANDIAQRYQQNMSEKYSVKDTADYLSRMMGNSMIGTLATMGATTKKTRQFMQEEMQKSREGKGAHYNSNMGTNLLGETLMFAADAAPLMIGGAIGNYTAKGVGSALSAMGKKELGALVSSSSPFLAANVGKAVKYGGMAGGAMARGIGSMAPFMAASSAVQDMSVGDGTLSSIGRAALEGAWEGAKFGAVTGAFGVGNQAMRSGLGSGWKATQAVESFLLENQIFAGLDYIKDPENFDWAESTENAFYMQMASKFSSLHGIEGVAREFKDIFGPARKSGIRLNDTDKESIQRAFAGKDFTDIASDVNNIGKILEDKRNIPWTTRQKVSGYTMNTFEPSRPRTERIKINGYDKTISEYGQDGELIEVHKYESPDDLLDKRTAIEDRRRNEDMLADFGNLALQNNGRELNDIMTQFAQEHEMTPQEVVDIMMKEPIERVDDEPDLMYELSLKLHEAAFPKGKPHPAQSHIDGETLAGDEATMNPETAASVAQEVREAREAYLTAPRSDEMQQAINALGPDARLDDIYMYMRENFSGPEVDNFLEKLADYANAKAKQQGYIDKTGMNIDDQVDQDVSEKSFHGTMDGMPDDANIITISKDGEEFILVNGDLGTRDGSVVDPDKSSGQIILRAMDGRFVPTKPDALMTVSKIEPKDYYADRVREELQLQDTNTALETGLVEPPKPEEPKAVEGGTEGSGVVENAESETGTGENELYTTAISKIPTLKDQEGKDILDEEGDAQYQWEQAPLEDTLAALSEINRGDNQRVVDTVDAMQKAAAKEVEAADKLKPKSSDPIKRVREQDKIDAQKVEAQNKLDYWTAAKDALEKANKPETELNVEPTAPIVPENDLTLRPASEKAKAKTADEKRADRIVQLKEQYGEHFDDDFTKAQSAEELASMYVGRNRTLSREDLAKELGYKLGLSTDEPWAETLLAKKGEGKTLWEVAHAAYESDENPVVDNEGNRMFSDQEIHDALINIFRDSKKKSDIMDYAINAREEIAKKNFEEAKRREAEMHANEDGIELSDEEIERIKSGLPFEQSTDEVIPESPLKALKETAVEMMKEEGTPNIEVVNTDRISERGWRELAEEAYEGAFIGEEEVNAFREAVIDEGVFFNPETGKITVFSGKLSPEELRNRVNAIKERINNGYFENEEIREDRDSLERDQESGGRGEGKEAGEGRPSQSSTESERVPESSERDEYLKPRNEKEKQIVSDVEAKLAEEIKAAEEEVRKARSELSKAEAKESVRATDLFGNDNAMNEPGQLFDNSDMPIDRSRDGIERRTAAERERYQEARNKLEQLQSQAEHDSRVRGALDNERRQTSIEEDIDERQKREYDEYIKPLLDKSDEELQRLKKEKEDAVGSDLTKLNGDLEYSGIINVITQRMIDKQIEDFKKGVHSRENLERKKKSLTERAKRLEDILQERPSDRQAQIELEGYKKRIAEIDKELAQKEEQGDYKVGDKFEIVDDSGEIKTAEVERINDYGNIVLKVDGKNPTVTPKQLDEYRERRNNYVEPKPFEPSDKTKELSDKAQVETDKLYDLEQQRDDLINQRDELEASQKGTRGAKREEIENQLKGLRHQIHELNEKIDKQEDKTNDAVYEWRDSERVDMMEHFGKMSDEEILKLVEEKEKAADADEDALYGDPEYTALIDIMDERDIDRPIKTDNPVVAIEEAAGSFQKKQDKQIGVTRDETPQQIADRERAEKLADTPLTSEEVDSSSASDVQKTLAKAYLDGNHGILQEAAYLNVYNDVRNRRQDSEGNRPDANGTQLGGTENNGEQRPGRTGERNLFMDEAEGGEPESGQRRVENGEGQLHTTDGESGDRGVSEPKPEVDGVSSGGEQPEGSGRPRSERPDVRGGEQERRSSEDTGKPAAGSDAAIAASKQRLAELRKKFKDAGKRDLSISLVGMNNEQIGILGEIITESANLGYQYLNRGMRDFNEWRKQMLSDFKDWLQADFNWTDSDVEEYLREVWNCEYNIDGVTRTIAEWASFIGDKEIKKIVKQDLGTKFEQQKAAESVETKVGDIDNIRESLPFLLPEQQDDVYKAETQFFNEQHQDREHGFGKGMMFTNGTGTGKTYTGLGIVKRFVKQGKGRVLILTPSQEKVGDWRKDGLNLGLDIESLDEEAKIKGTSATKSKGKGVVVTTYANARQNLAMLEDCFDLIVYDESHKIMESKEATNTTMMDFHEMLTNKNVERSMDRQTYWLPEWIEHRNLLREREENRERLDNLDQYSDDETIKVDGNDVVVGELKTKLNVRMVEIEKRLEELRPIMQEIRESKRPQAEIDSKRTKTVFLSATPFNVRESLRYAEGYLFSFPEEDKNTIGTYNHRSPEDAFLEQMFPAGYRWRYGRLESHVSNAEALGRQEIGFSDYLQNTLQTMSGRMISSDYDYSRDFPVMTLDHAGRFNQAMSEVYRNKRYQPLAEAFRKAFDYNYSTALFEAMKTSLVNERIKQHLKRGQKVVVFHRRRTSGELEPPFRRALEMARVQASMEQDQNTKTKILTAIKAFEEDFSDMLEWEKTLDYTLPREQIEKVFGKDKVAFFSGAETKKTKHKSVEEFMKDNGGKDIIVIQEASGKEGISLHDQTGEHQRVEINLALPQSPIAFIQIEGRIYRIGQKSNAIFEYPLLGLDLETNLFAQKFNGALGTTENLALGSKARNLRKSIANSVLENTGEVDYDRQGLGGKDMDGRVDEAGDKDGFDVSIQDYYGNQKMKRGRDDREGVDYFPTPEPIGYKMVEWGQMMDGETALEPSAGHGAIARYVPETNGMTAIEPSSSLFTKLQMRAGGPGRRFEEMPFEDYPLANKHDVVLMNPPYGVGGKTAMEHVAKAFKHLNEGGRVIAIIPDGPAMDKRMEAWLNSTGSDGLNGAAVVTGEVKLPSVAFGRAGTNVRTRVVVIDKVTRAEMRKNMPQKVTVDLSGEESIGGLFDRIRDVRMPERTIDQVAINEKRAKKTERQFDDNPFVSSSYIGQDYRGNSMLRVSTRSGGNDIDINIDLGKEINADAILDSYEKLKKYRDNPEKLDYGRWENRTFGSGKNRVPALDAIRDYCDTAIKTLENLSRMTADQMDKAVRLRNEEIERRRQEQEAAWREEEAARKLERERKEQERLEKYRQARETLLQEFGDKDGKEWVENNMEDAWSSVPIISIPARRRLTNMGIDWETGHVTKREEPVTPQPQNVQVKPDYEYALDKNTRTGADMHLVKYNGSRLSDDQYRAVERKAKAQNGYYNRFKKAWHFDTEADARKFAESLNGTTFEEGTTRMRLREKPAPKKTQKVFKLMRLGDDGKLYPLFIDSASPTELGKWYDADSPDVKNLEGLEPGFAYKIDKDGNVVETKPVNRTKTTITGLPNVKKINDATNEESRWITVTTDKKGAKTYHNVGINGSGQPGVFAMRPGWHAGSLPSMRQIGKGKDRNLRDDRFVWVEGEVPADVDYQEEANGNPFKDIPTHIPEDGFYMKATNANKEASQADRIGWYVAGAFKANRIMSDHEARKAIDDWNREHPDQKVEYDFERESGKEFNAETMRLEDRPTTRFSRRTRNKKTPETNVVPGEQSPFKATGFSSVDGAKVRNDLETLAEKSVNISLKAKNSFISDLAETMKAVPMNSGSRYAKYETKSGDEVLFRFADHNATVSNFDNNNEKNGISIVISRKENEGLEKDGNAHVVEFYYPDKELKKADGNPYAEIVKSIHQALYSGEYKDTTGIAQREEANGTVEEVETRMRSRDNENPIEADFRRKEEAGRKLAKKLNSDFEAITSPDQIKNKEVKDAIAAGNEVPGWIEIGKDGKKKIFLYLPHVRDTYDAEKTIAHETIGHQGFRELLGEKGYKSYMRSLALDLKSEELSKYISENLAKNGFDMYRTIDEFLAEAAEKGYGDLSFWQKVKEKVTDVLRSAGFTMSPSISDVKYMVWLSKHNLEKGNAMNQVEREALLYRLGKERYEAKVRNGEYSYENMAEENGSVPYFSGDGKTLFRHTPSVKNQRQNYERALKRMGYVWKEAHIDAMQSAIELMRSISGVKKIEDIPSAENFVLLENQMSSKEEQMDFLFNRDYMKPLDDAVSRCLPDMGNGIDEQLRNLQVYMIKKHGLERNRVLFVRDAIRELRKDPSVNQQQVDQLEQDYNRLMSNLRFGLRHDVIDLKEYHEEVDNWIKSNIDPKYKPGEKDYSGLTDLYGKGFNDADVIDEVMSTESMLGKDRTSDLWDKTNAVSKFGLDMEYEGGLDSKEKHDKVADMFEWYVPLRGYDEKTAEEVYDYLEEHGNDRKWAGPVLMNAKGRESLADVDVFATLGAMNSSAINRSLRNQMKQAFARFVRNHYNDVDADNRLVTELPYLWAEKQHDPITGAEVWVEKFPDIPENAKADDIAAILDQYQQDMKAKEASGDAKRVRQNSNIPFRPAKPEHKSQHIVDVWINGEKHSFVVNGNPRAAQAINGQLKAERNSNILWLSDLSHFMAKMNTSYSPDFIMRNTERDLFYSAANIAVKENYKYWVKWAKNYGVATGRVAAGVPAMHTNLFKRYRDGNLNMANSTDRYFKEFMENGGETGWVERKNLDKWKKAIKQGVKKDSKPEEIGKAVINALPDAIEAMNERAENMARFATYMTSREMGRSITRSVSDAKEVSVNFNRKGAGSKTVGLNKGDNSWLRNANAYMAGWSAQNLQDYIMFYNAGVQGMTNMIKNVANHPIKGSIAFAAFALAGMLMPQLNQYLFEEDDDKKDKLPENPYAELPEYVRRNNLCVYGDNGNFITIALPIELRAMYGIGDMAASYINHPELRSTKNMGEDIVTQLSQVAPLDFFGEGAGPMWAMVPSGVRPFAEAAANKNWLGQPIERDEERWNENKPRWTRAFKNVGDAYVGASKRLNAATNPYNDENIKGWADGAITDPALVEHIVNGYFGGVGSTVNRVAQLAKHASEMSPKEAITSNWMPIVRTQHYTPNERTRYARTRNKWWYYKEEADKTQETIKVLKKRGEHDPVSFMQSISEEEGKKGTRAKVMEKAYKNYTKVKEKMEKTDDLQQKDIYQLQMDQIMEGAVKELDKIK